jgi:hypothetical protein
MSGEAQTVAPVEAAATSALEREIDRIVYDLYGLTEEEIAIVEGENENFSNVLKKSICPFASWSKAVL